MKEIKTFFENGFEEFESATLYYGSVKELKNLIRFWDEKVAEYYNAPQPLFCEEAKFNPNRKYCIELQDDGYYVIHRVSGYILRTLIELWEDSTTVKRLDDTLLVY